MSQLFTIIDSYDGAVCGTLEAPTFVQALAQFIRAAYNRPLDQSDVARYYPAHLAQVPRPGSRIAVR